MVELFANMGFLENPFSKFSAEEERSYLKNIFVSPKHYSTIHSDIVSGSSRFIFGERGVGKSALAFTLMRDFSKDNVLSVIIDDYEGISLSANGKTLVILALRKLVTIFSLYLIKNKRKIRILDRVEQEKLALIINTFFETLSKKQFDELYERTTHRKTFNILKVLFDILRVPMNIFISSSSEFFGSTINKALGLPAQISESVYKEYIPSIKKEDAPDKLNLDAIEYSTVKTLLLEFSLIVKKCGFARCVVIFDKIDEYRLLGTQVANITTFIKDLVLDTALLLNGDVSFVFSIWNRLRQSLTELGVRFDKLKPFDINWSAAELEKIINNRLKFFSKGQISSIQQIIPQEYIEQIMSLANCSPRHLIMLLSKVYDEQAVLDDTSKVFTKEALEGGLRNFARTFDFSTYYAGSNPSTMRKIVAELLRIKKVEFETKDIIDAFKISSQASNRKIQIMLDHGLIEDITAGTHTKRYRLLEPRIEYLINNDIKI